MTRIPDEGRLDARIVLIDDAPGRWEAVRGRPCAGPAGGRLDEWLEAVRLTRNDLYLMHVVPERYHTVTEDDLCGFYNRLRLLTNPIVLVRPPFQVSFAFAGRDRIWQETWHDVVLPNAVRVTVRNAVTDQILPVSTATLLNVNAPAECAQTTGTACGGQNNGGAIPNGPGTAQPGTTQPGPAPPPQ